MQKRHSEKACHRASHRVVPCGKFSFFFVELNAERRTAARRPVHETSRSYRYGWPYLLTTFLWSMLVQICAESHRLLSFSHARTHTRALGSPKSTVATRPWGTSGRKQAPESLSHHRNHHHIGRLDVVVVVGAYLPTYVMWCERVQTNKREREWERERTTDFGHSLTHSPFPSSRNCFLYVLNTPPLSPSQCPAAFNARGAAAHSQIWSPLMLRVVKWM